MAFFLLWIIMEDILKNVCNQTVSVSIPIGSAWQKIQWKSKRTETIWLPTCLSWNNGQLIYCSRHTCFSWQWLFNRHRTQLMWSVLKRLNHVLITGVFSSFKDFVLSIQLCGSQLLLMILEQLSTLSAQAFDEKFSRTQLELTSRWDSVSVSRFNHRKLSHDIYYYSCSPNLHFLIISLFFYAIYINLNVVDYSQLLTIWYTLYFHFFLKILFKCSVNYYLCTLQNICSIISLNKLCANNFFNRLGLVSSRESCQKA